MRTRRTGKDLTTESFDDAARRLLQELNARKMHRAAGPEEFENSGHEGAGAGLSRRDRVSPATSAVLRLIDGGMARAGGRLRGDGEPRPPARHLSEVRRPQEEQAFEQDLKLSGQPVPSLIFDSRFPAKPSKTLSDAGCQPGAIAEYESTDRQRRVANADGLVPKDEE